MVVHTAEDNGCLSGGMRWDRSTVYLSTTMGPSTNTAKPGQGRWLRLGWAAIKTAKGGKGGILLRSISGTVNECLVFVWAIIRLVNVTIIIKKKLKGEACNCPIFKIISAVGRGIVKNAFRFLCSTIQVLKKPVWKKSQY